jgi:hypothetical protein
MALLDLVVRTAGNVVNALQMGSGQRIVPPKVTVVTDGGPPSGAAIEWARRVVNRVRQATLSGTQIRWPQWTDPISGNPQAMFDAYEAMTRDPMAWRALTTLVDAVARSTCPSPRRTKTTQRQQTVVAFHKEALDRAGGKLSPHASGLPPGRHARLLALREVVPDDRRRRVRRQVGVSLEEYRPAARPVAVRS